MSSKMNCRSIVTALGSSYLFVLIQLVLRSCKLALSVTPVFQKAIEMYFEVVQHPEWFGLPGTCQGMYPVWIVLISSSSYVFLTSLFVASYTLHITAPFSRRVGIWGELRLKVTQRFSRACVCLSPCVLSNQGGAGQVQHGIEDPNMLFRTSISRWPNRQPQSIQDTMKQQRNTTTTTNGGDSDDDHNNHINTERGLYLRWSSIGHNNNG